MSTFVSKEELQGLVDRMVADLQKSEAFKTKIRQANVSVGFLVTDLAADITLQVHRGDVRWEEGIANEATVVVSLKSDVFDSIFSGKQDPESAYMYGSLILRGDEYTAQGLLYYWPELVASYKTALASQAGA